jgi:rod shape-determining protein MreC
MAKKIPKVSERTLFTCLMLAGLIFLFVPQRLASKFQFAFVHFFHGPLSICRSFTLFAPKHRSSTDVVSRSEYTKLRNHLANNIQLLQQEHQKVKKLSGLYDRFAWKGVNFVLADVITAFIDGARGEFIINRGENDGLAKGQFVLNHFSIIGTVSDFDSRTARVQLVTDPKSKIAVEIAELNVEGIMQGDGNDSAKIRLLPTKYKIKVGDIVYAQKKPGLLDVPMIVGTVSQCKRDDKNPLLWDITVKPACDIGDLSSVAVIIMNPREQQQTEYAEPTNGCLSALMKK